MLSYDNDKESKIHLLSSEWVDDHSGIVQSQKFDRWYRNHNKDYTDALAEMTNTTHKTASEDTFIQYCKVQARHAKLMQSYRTNMGVLSGRIRRREKAQRTDGQVARLVAMRNSVDVEKAVKNDTGFTFRDVSCDKRGDKFVDSVFFGNGAVNIRGKGHRGYSKKGVIRALACSIFPGGKRVQAVVFNEWGTSSRCPCGSCVKMTSSHGKKTTQNTKKGRKGKEGEGYTDVSQPCNGFTRESGTSTTDTNTVNNNDNDNNQPALMRDTRFEVCSICKTEWPHDVVSVVNMLQISTRMIRGDDRPTWLSPAKKENVDNSKGSGI